MRDACTVENVTIKKASWKGAWFIEPEWAISAPKVQVFSDHRFWLFKFYFKVFFHWRIKRIQKNSSILHGQKSLLLFIYRPHTTVKNARNMKSLSRAKLPYFEGIFNLWTHDQEDLTFLQIFISFANQNIAVLCVKRPWNGFRFSWNFWCCMRSYISQFGPGGV